MKDVKRRLAPAALVLAVALLAPSVAAAEWQIKPFLGFTFGGQTTFIDLELAADQRHLVYGVSGVALGEVFGLEGEVSRVPRFFESGNQSLVSQSSVTLLMGNAVVALPRRLSAYSLRPYFVAGAGMMRVHIEDPLEVFPVSDHRLAFDVGGGATGFLTDFVGVSWDVRYFRRLAREEGGLGPGASSNGLSFWRLSMSAVFRP